MGDIVVLILTVIAIILSAIFVTYALWIGMVSFLGNLKAEKVYPKAMPHTFAILICARNEEMVIKPTIDSLLKQNYPENSYTVFVVAHNCTDNTASVAEQAGAKVYIRNNPGEMKAQAMAFGLDCIEKDYGNFYEYVAMFDADALVDENFLQEINNAVVATDADCAAGYYNSKNFNKNTISKLAGLLYHGVMRSNSIPNSNLNLPVNAYGSGYAFKFKWKYLFKELDTIAEDFELSCLLVLNGAKMVEAQRAVFYAEMPETFSEAIIQRRRWSYGDTQCYRKLRKRFRRAIFKQGIGAFKQYMDLILNPLALIAACGVILWIVCDILTGFNPMHLIVIAAVILGIYLVFEIMLIFTMKKAGIGIKNNIKAMLIFPAWSYFLSAGEGIVSTFRRKMEWKPTKRNSNINISEIKK